MNLISPEFYSASMKFYQKTTSDNLSVGMSYQYKLYHTFTKAVVSNLGSIVLAIV